MNTKRYLRLLPSVILVGGGLLALNASGIIHDAYALDSTAPATADAMAPAPKPGNADYAGDDGQMASAAEVDVLTSLSKRRGELDARESQVQTQTNMLAATETRIDTKIAQLKALQTQIAALLVQRDDAQAKQIASLIKTYGPDGMKPASAAIIFNTLPDEVLVPVAQGMKPGDLGAILSKMNPDAAQKLTLKLANKLALPDTTALAGPASTLPPGPSASAAPATPGAPGAQASAAPAAAPATAAAGAPKTGG